MFFLKRAQHFKKNDIEKKVKMFSALMSTLFVCNNVNIKASARDYEIEGEILFPPGGISNANYEFVIPTKITIYWTRGTQNMGEIRVCKFEKGEDTTQRVVVGMDNNFEAASKMHPLFLESLNLFLNNPIIRKQYHQYAVLDLNESVSMKTEFTEDALDFSKTMSEKTQFTVRFNSVCLSEAEIQELRDRSDSSESGGIYAISNFES